jgi:hypothetical protein
MSVLIAEVGWDEDGRARKWAVPSNSHPGAFYLVQRDEGLVCTCPAGVRNARAGKGRPNPTYCIHVRLVARLEQERVA